MDVLRDIIQLLMGACGVFVTVMVLYQVWISIHGFKKKTKGYDDHDPQAKFLVLVPAHNEEAVIADIIENLQQMEYPTELYDFYIIADNCTDATAAVAMGMGANVLVTEKETPDSPTGKPVALKKALDMLPDYQHRYDLLMIFDADNLIDKNMLAEVNSQYISEDKPELIQCYLGCKNNKGIVPWYYYTTFTISNRFFQLGRHSDGINCSIGGTGFAISTQYLHQRGGWTTMSLTEDFEIQVEATLEGKRIVWNHQVRVYDEKPRQFLSSYRQLVRWAQGRWFVTFRNTKRLFQALFRKELPLREGVSLLSFMYSPLSYFVVIYQFLGEIILRLMGPGTPPDVAPKAVEKLAQSGSLTTVIGLILFLYSFFFLFYMADWMDNGRRFSLKTLPMMLISFLTNMVLSTVAQIVGVFRYKQQNQWVKTEHFIRKEDADEAIISEETSGPIARHRDKKAAIRKAAADTSES